MQVDSYAGYVELERAVGKNEKFESFKLKSLKLKRAKRSWEEPIEVGKNRAKLKSSF